MDDQRFDRLTRAFAATPSRRQLIKAGLGAAGAAVLTAVRGQNAAACAGLGQSCSKSNPCCAGRCSGGVCVCPKGTTRCGDACLDTQTDPRNCGGCGQECLPGQACTGGVCRCPKGTTLCDGACIDTSSDEANCGGCGVVCASTACADAVCRNGRCKQINRPAGAPCDAAGPCSEPAICDGSGTCTGGAPVICQALDDCHDPGVCDPATGQCSNPPRPDGTPCSDTNACTDTDTCRAGVCTSGTDVLCPPPGPCQEPGVCNPVTGQCGYTDKADGTPCDDGNACTRTDTCRQGICVGEDPVVCTALDACHQPGMCDPATGACSNPPKPDGTPCSDDNACTDTDTCQAGVCTPGTAVVCPPPGACRLAGVCDPATGECGYAVAPDGTSCDDGDPCTIGDACRGGECFPGEPRDCGESNGCTLVGCDSETGECFSLKVADYTPCEEDDDLCTDDYCIDGVCTHPPKVCDDGDPCTLDWCDPATGFCLIEMIDCDDDDDCTFDYCDEDGLCQHEPIEGCPGCEDPGCPEGMIWDAIECVCVCFGSGTQCHEVCTDTQTDPSNCGQCGRDCNANAGPCDLFDCVDGQCQLHSTPCGGEGGGACPGASVCCVGSGPFASATCCCPDSTCCVGTVQSTCCRAHEICWTEGNLGNFAHCSPA